MHLLNGPERVDDVHALVGLYDGEAHAGKTTNIQALSRSLSRAVARCEPHLLHVFMRSSKDQSHAAVFVCRGTVNIGMALAKARSAMKILQEAI